MNRKNDMLKINRDDQSFSLLDTPTLADVSITERYDLQEFISNTPDAFFREIGQELFLLGKEIAPSKNVQDRIDLLAIDKEGACVVIELKRGNHKLQMFQAISYAAMVSQWESDQCLELLDEEQQEALSEFLDVDQEDINHQQRIILIAEAYDYALLMGAEWLTEEYGVGITCCRIAIAKDATSKSEYLVCSNVYPLPELSKEALPRGRRRGGSGAAKWADWETALASVENDTVVAYFERELASDRDSYLARRELWYRVGGRRRWTIAARKQKAYVWQHDRFENDAEFWQQGLSKPDDVKPVKDGKCLRFFLTTADDFRFFHDAVTERLQSTEWFGGVPEDERADADTEE